MRLRFCGFLLAAGLSLEVGCAGEIPAAVQPEPNAALPSLPSLQVKRTRVFKGEDGLRLEVVEFGEASALVRIVGHDGDLGDAVLSYEIRNNGRDTTYTTQWNGRSWNVLVRRVGHRGGRPSWHSYLPGSGQRGGYALKYSEALSGKVDVTEIHRAHVKQKASGRLDAVQRFDRVAEQAAEDASLQHQAERTSEKCHVPLKAAVVWESVTDEQMLSNSVSGYCSSAFSALRNVCRFKAGRDHVKAHIGEVGCRLDGAGEMAIENSRLSWAINFELYNLDQKAREALMAVSTGRGTLAARIEVEKTVVCADDSREHVVIVGPRESAHGGMAYGSADGFVKVSQPKMLSSGWFLEPRAYNPKHHEAFRGYDLRVYSYIDVSPDKPESSCLLHCGTREIQLSQLSTEEKEKTLAGAAYEVSPWQREPYALARDRRGRYYYVDRGITPETHKDFRLYRGKRGRMRQLNMRDVVSDSEGEVFVSKGGRLRLIVDKTKAQWVASGKARALQRLPLAENLALIYNELGIHLGQPLGTPCDDL